MLETIAGIGNRRPALRECAVLWMRQRGDEMIYDTGRKVIRQKGIQRKHRRGAVRLTVRDGKTSQSGGTHKLSLGRQTGIVPRERGKGVPYTGSSIIPRGFDVPGPHGDS